MSVQGLVAGDDKHQQAYRTHAPIQQSFDQQYVLSPLQTKMRGDLNKLPGKKDPAI